MSLQQLDPNCVVSFEYSKKNEDLLVSALHKNGLPNLVRPGETSDIGYAFVRFEKSDDGNTGAHNKHYQRTSQTISNFHNLITDCNFIKEVTPFYDVETSKKLNELSAQLIFKDFFHLPKDYELLDFNNLTNNPRQSLYFAFFKNYMNWLGILSIVGATFRFFTYSQKFPWEFNSYYCFFLVSWSMLFVAQWIYKKQKYYNAKFNTFLYVSTNSHDLTSKTVDTPVSVMLKKCCFIPIILLFVTVLLLLQFGFFLIEIFITQLYSGPFVSILSLLPTVLNMVCVPLLMKVYNTFFVNKFVSWENGPNEETSKLEKNFIFTFLINYVPLLITLFIYLPFGYQLFPNWNQFSAVRAFKVNASRHQSQFFYFIVTNQLIIFAMDNILPTVLSLVKGKLAKNTKDNKTITMMRDTFKRDVPQWEKLLKGPLSGRQEFDLNANYQKIILQFGFISMFSVVWPLAPLFCYLINTITFKADLWKVLNIYKPSNIALNLFSPHTHHHMHANLKNFFWNKILIIMIGISGTIAMTLTFMYRSCYLPGVGVVTTVSSTWYLNSPLSHHWTTILLVSMVFEHVVLLSFHLVRKIIIASEESTNGCFVPTRVETLSSSDITPITTTKSTELLGDEEKTTNIPTAEKKNNTELVSKSQDKDSKPHATTTTTTTNNLSVVAPGTTGKLAS